MADKITACPGWLEVSEDRRSFIKIPERTKIVCRIFEYSRDGMGGYTIANRLNAEGVRSFGPSQKWQQSTINNMLRNRATLGEHQPKRLEGRKRAPFGDPIKSYYPPVISEELFNAVQAARQEHLKSHRGRKGPGVSNLFSGLACCAYCGGRMKLKVNIGQVTYQGGYLVCQNSYSGNGCIAARWRYVEFETAMLDFIRGLETGNAISLGLVEVNDIARQHRERIDSFLSRSIIAARLKSAISRLAVATQPSPERHITITLRNGRQWRICPDRR
jgi:hypothetical protein